MLMSFLLAVHVLLALILIGVILLQQGKGATAGAAFGSGASSTVFGARGSASFLTRLTAILATLFFANSLLLTHFSSSDNKPQSLLDRAAVSAPEVPGVPGDKQPVSDVPQDVPKDLPPVPAAPASPGDVPAAAAPAAPPANTAAGDGAPAAPPGEQKAQQ